MEPTAVDPPEEKVDTSDPLEQLADALSKIADTDLDLLAVPEDDAFLRLLARC